MADYNVSYGETGTGIALNEYDSPYVYTGGAAVNTLSLTSVNVQQTPTIVYVNSEWASLQDRRTGHQ